MFFRIVFVFLSGTVPTRAFECLSEFVNNVCVALCLLECLSVFQNGKAAFRIYFSRVGVEAPGPITG